MNHKLATVILHSAILFLAGSNVASGEQPDLSSGLILHERGRFTISALCFVSINNDGEC